MQPREKQLLVNEVNVLRKLNFDPVVDAVEGLVAFLKAKGPTSHSEIGSANVSKHSDISQTSQPS
jgi:hypothetical protein